MSSSDCFLASEGSFEQFVKKVPGWLEVVEDDSVQICVREGEIFEGSVLGFLGRSV